MGLRDRSATSRLRDTVSNAYESPPSPSNQMYLLYCMAHLLRDFLRVSLVGRDEKKRVTGVLAPVAAAGHRAVLKVLEVSFELLSRFWESERSGDGTGCRETVRHQTTRNDLSKPEEKAPLAASFEVQKIVHPYAQEAVCLCRSAALPGSMSCEVKFWRPERI